MNIRYADYLQSPHWLRLRQRYRDTRPWECICGRRTGLQLHHITYERLGAEKLDDLRPLCRPCHSRLHELARLNPAGDLDPRTYAHRLLADAAIHGTRDAPFGEPERVAASYENTCAARALDLRMQMAILRQAERLAQPIGVRLARARADASKLRVDIRPQLFALRRAVRAGRSARAIMHRVEAIEAKLYPTVRSAHYSAVSATAADHRVFSESTGTTAAP